MICLSKKSSFLLKISAVLISILMIAAVAACDGAGAEITESSSPSVSNYEGVISDGNYVDESSSYAIVSSEISVEEPSESSAEVSSDSSAEVSSDSSAEVSSDSSAEVSSDGSAEISSDSSAEVSSDSSAEVSNDSSAEVSSDSSSVEPQEKNKYTVSFYVEGELLVSYEVVEGEGVAEMPEVTAKTGYNGAWDATLTDLSVVEANVDVNAVYTAKTYAVVLDLNGGRYNGTTPMTEGNVVYVTYGEAYDFGEPTRNPTDYAKGFYVGNTKIESSGVWLFDDVTTVTFKWSSGTNIY